MLRPGMLDGPPSPPGEFYNFKHPGMLDSPPSPPGEFYNFKHPGMLDGPPSPPGEFYNFKHPGMLDGPPSLPGEFYNFKHPGPSGSRISRREETLDGAGPSSSPNSVSTIGLEESVNSSHGFQTEEEKECGLDYGKCQYCEVKPDGYDDYLMHLKYAHPKEMLLDNTEIITDVDSLKEIYSPVLHHEDPQCKHKTKKKGPDSLIQPLRNLRLANRPRYLIQRSVFFTAICQAVCSHCRKPVKRRVKIPKGGNVIVFSISKKFSKCSR